MKLIIEIDLDNAAFEDVGELRRILGTITQKVAKQLGRPPSLCDAPEAADKLFDLNGNAVGSIKIVGD